MRTRDFFRDKALFIIALLLTAAFSATLLHMAGGSLYFALFIPCLFLIACALALLREALTKRAYYKNLEKLLSRLEEKHLLSELVERPDFYEGGILCDVLKAAGKSMNDEIAKYRLASLEYREYIELWVHEIKTPIAGAKLICENIRNPELLAELDEIERFVEQALFYSRSGNVEGDYLIRRTDLASLVHGALKTGARRLIARKVSVRAGDLAQTVFTDAKWLDFILRQIIDNAVKYGCKKLEFFGEQGANSVSLFVRDDGAGIVEKDLGRVFDKGFTGENGRRFGRSTGMGLYLCRKLCLKLGLEISISSRAGEGTAVEILFPRSGAQLQDL